MESASLTRIRGGRLQVADAVSGDRGSGPDAVHDSGAVGEEAVRAAIVSSIATSILRPEGG
jgi:hypothetical protein